MDTMNHLFYEAAILMIVGMLFVYAFLGLLVVVVKTVITPLANYFPDPVKTNKISQRSSSPSVTGASAAIVAAITGAVSQYRQQKNINQ